VQEVVGGLRADVLEMFGERLQTLALAERPVSRRTSVGAA
jgi:hypothetical protein